MTMSVGHFVNNSQVAPRPKHLQTHLRSFAVCFPCTWSKILFGCEFAKKLDKQSFFFEQSGPIQEVRTGLSWIGPDFVLFQGISPTGPCD